MGGGKGGSSTPQYDPMEGQAYLNRNPDVYAAQMDPWVHYQRHGQAEGRYWGLDTPSFFMPELPVWEAPEPVYEAPQQKQQQPDIPSYEEQMEDQQQLLDEQQAEQERQLGLSQRDELYTAYMDAAGSATDFINAEITDERANAALLGIDYNMTDEIKSQRISDYFATVWGEGQQSQLEGLIEAWGEPTGFDGFSIKRGNSDTYAPKEGSEKQVGKSQGVKPTIATAEEEDTLGTQSVLGG